MDFFNIVLPYLCIGLPLILIWLNSIRIPRLTHVKGAVVASFFSEYDGLDEIKHVAKQIHPIKNLAFALYPERIDLVHRALRPSLYRTIPARAIQSYYYKRYLGEISCIWIHYIHEQKWYLIKLDNIFDERQSERLLTHLSIMTENHVKLAYARQPYIHRSIIQANYARQRLTGDWELLEAQSFFLVPNFLVFISPEGDFLRSIACDSISEVEALSRLDDKETGILSFRSGEEVFRFALKDYEAWANDLARAASIAQEIPLEAEFLEPKQKYED
jgi:hypothetical protein